MLKVTITKEVIDWLSSELGYSEDHAEEFAQDFISLLQASGGLTPINIHDRFLKAAKDHYWDTFEPDRAIILKHIEGIIERLQSQEIAEQGAAPDQVSKSHIRFKPVYKGYLGYHPKMKKTPR